MDISVKLFHAIPKIRKCKQSATTVKKYDIKKEMLTFERNVDYARSREYEFKKFLKHEVVNTSFFLTKDGYLQKSVKSEMSTELNKMQNAKSLIL